MSWDNRQTCHRCPLLSAPPPPTPLRRGVEWDVVFLGYIDAAESKRRKEHKRRPFVPESQRPGAVAKQGAKIESRGNGKGAVRGECDRES